MTWQDTWTSGSSIIKQQARTHWKISLIAMLIVTFIVGVSFGAAFFSGNINLKRLPGLAEDDLSCFDILTRNRLSIDYDEVFGDCVWPRPDLAQCGITVCGHTFYFELVGVK